jgi:hypothetical protein
MTHNEQPGVGLPLVASPLFMAERGRSGPRAGDVTTADSEPRASSGAPLTDRAILESEPQGIRHSMPADFPVADWVTDKGPSPQQLARRVRFQRIVVALVALLGIFDVVTLWMHYR